MLLESLVGSWLALAPVASAPGGWEVGGGVEEFLWQEFDAGGRRLLDERGERLAASVAWQSRGARVVRFVYEGKLYLGVVDYDGATQAGAPVQTDTSYFGMMHEGRLHLRLTSGAYPLEGFAAGGYEGWRRAIANDALGFDQLEDYNLLYLKTGISMTNRSERRGWHGALGVKYPVIVSEDAHLPDYGYTSNPELEPKGRLSFTGEVGWRITGRFNLTAYYDSWRFARSDEVQVRDGTGAMFRVWQPESSADLLGLRLRYHF